MPFRRADRPSDFSTRFLRARRRSAIIERVEKPQCPRFQFSLRTAGLLIGLVALGFAAGIGVAVTATVLTIVVVVCLLYSLIPHRRRSRSVRIAAAAVTMLAVYLGSFAAFRAFRTYPFSLAPLEDPQSRLVIFSLEPSVQQFARDLYSPLIRLFPAHCYYPDSNEMRLLNRDPFTGKRTTLD